MTCLVTFRLLLSLHDSLTAFDLKMAEPAEVENPEPPPTKKPRRQCHFNPSWVQNDADAQRGFSILWKNIEPARAILL